MHRLLILTALSLGLLTFLGASPFPNFQITKDSIQPPVKVTSNGTKWYDKLSIRGYTQLRYNRLLETNDKLRSESNDRSIGDKQGFSFRRGRLIFSGDAHERLFFYIQTDFAASASSSALHYFQIRDAYFDLAFDEKKEFRIRFGQSKVPFGFANLQSSSNRLPFDRDDALNSTVPGERDLGAFFYWAPEKSRAYFKELATSRLKGSGDYGVFGLGLYNGQTMGRPEANNNLHSIAHLSWPMKLPNGQFIEGGLHAYTGKITLPSLSNDSIANSKKEYLDQRVAASFVIYPQPFGLQAEYNIGVGPEYDPASNSVLKKKLAGGYVLASYALPVKHQLFIPFCRYQWYEGGKKMELDARSHTVSETEFGVEWQVSKAVELTMAYLVSDRRFEDAAKPVNRQKGQLLRLQMQFNY